MDPDAELIPSSPTISSVSSDLDTESTGSFFRDRSTTLGTLMGVTLPDTASARHSRAPCPQAAAAAAAAAAERRRRRKRGGSWWRLCRDDMRPTSLGDFLQMERRLAEVDHGGGGPPEHESVGGGPLFRDGRVLPPPLPPPPERRRSAAVGAGSFGRLPVMLTGICSGGEG